MFQTEIYTFRIFIRSFNKLVFNPSCLRREDQFVVSFPRGARKHDVVMVNDPFSDLPLFLVVKNPYDLRSQIRNFGFSQKTHPNKPLLNFKTKGTSNVHIKNRSHSTTFVFTEEWMVSFFIFLPYSLVEERSALVNIRRKALGHLMTFTQGRLKYTYHQPQPKKGI